ncbi:MAG: molybdopterin-dependent oxidoreductase [Enterocloster aldenensis]
MDNICTMHKMHCCTTCRLKLWETEDGISRITSDGDISRGDADEYDSGLYPVQRRACMKGYSELYHMYSPDRILHPLKQTGSRGDRQGFRPISWDEAIDLYESYYESSLKKAGRLGYLPVLDIGGIGSFLGTTLRPFGASSCGNVDAAITAALGKRCRIHASRPMDMMNSNYIILWSSNPCVTVFPIPYVIRKAREKGIPITVVDCRYTESAGAFATGKNKVPPLICPYPATDGALMAAMSYVIYKRNLHDREFIRTSCFGFYPNDTVTSRSSETDPVTGQAYYGRTYRVPEGESFEEYLLGLEKEHGGYHGVLEWAAGTTGVDAEVIENFAIEYAVSSPAFIMSRFHGGAQRTYNGFYHSWMMIALCAMTGNLQRQGGGFGEMRGDDGYTVNLPSLPDEWDKQEKQPILISQYGIDQVILTGTDGRPWRQLREDVQKMNGIDIGGGLCLDGIVKGAANGNPFNQLANINKRRLAWQKLDYVVTYERHMTATAAWSDLVLPVTFPLENGKKFDKNSAYDSDIHVLNGVLEPVGEGIADPEVNRLIGRRFHLEKPAPDYGALMKRQWDKACLDPAYQKRHPAPLPDFETVVQNGGASFPVKPEEVPAPLMEYAPGTFPTETGKINFYSPFLASRDRTSHKINHACYVPLPDGRESIQASGSRGEKGMRSPSGRRYPLQFITPHAPGRANSDYGNTQVLKELHPHMMQIHPEDAAPRNIHENDLVYVYTDFGCIRIRAHITRSQLPGVIAIEQGTWYEPGGEQYRAFFDAGEGKAYHWTPVDYGGCANTLLEDVKPGIFDPFIDCMGFHAGGSACEVSRTLPDWGD